MKFEYEAPPEQAEVARALERDVQITKHAWERMFSRGIMFPTVLAAIHNGVSVPNNHNEIIRWKDWDVIMDENRVVSVFDRTDWRV